MREGIARKLLNRMGKHPSRQLQRMEIRILTRLAEEIFGKSFRQRLAASPERALEDYARFTVRCMEEGTPDPEDVFDRAFALGQRIRRLTGLHRREDLQRLVFLLYRNIDITMEGNLPGEIRVPHCYFSRFYTPAQCALMSGVDSGIISGILDGGRLVFSCRLTEGCQACRARFQGGEEG